MEQGLVEEAKTLFPFRHLKALKTVGYTEMFDYLENQYSLERAIHLIQQNTRRFAKRQMTWFRKDEEIKWLEASDLNSANRMVMEMFDNK